MIEHNYIAHEREGWSVCTRCGMVRNYDRPIAGCRGVTGNIAVRKPGKNIPEAARNTTRVSLRLPPEVAGLLRSRAKEAGLSVSDWIARLVTERT